MQYYTLNNCIFTLCFIWTMHMDEFTYLESMDNYSSEDLAGVWGYDQSESMFVQWKALRDASQYLTVEERELYNTYYVCRLTQMEMEKLYKRKQHLISRSLARVVKKMTYIVQNFPDVSWRAKANEIILTPDQLYVKNLYIRLQHIGKMSKELTGHYKRKVYRVEVRKILSKLVDDVREQSEDHAEVLRLLMDYNRGNYGRQNL